MDIFFYIFVTFRKFKNNFLFIFHLNLLFIGIFIFHLNLLFNGIYILISVWIIYVAAKLLYEYLSNKKYSGSKLNAWNWKYENNVFVIWWTKFCQKFLISQIKFFLLDFLKYIKSSHIKLIKAGQMLYFGKRIKMSQ